MACPICGRVYCDHSPAERGQTHEEMLADMTQDIRLATRTGDDDPLAAVPSKPLKRKKKALRRNRKK